MQYNQSFINNEFLDFFERGKLEFELYDDDIIYQIHKTDYDDY